MTVNDDDIQRIIAEAEEEARGMERVALEVHYACAIGSWHRANGERDALRLKWTREVPTVAGLYFHRTEYFPQASVYRVSRGQYASSPLFVENLRGGVYTLDEAAYKFGGEWAGPIAEPVDE
jgi:hypothetical protein